MAKTPRRHPGHLSDQQAPAHQGAFRLPLATLKGGDPGVTQSPSSSFHLIVLRHVTSQKNNMVSGWLPVRSKKKITFNTTSALGGEKVNGIKINLYSLPTSPLCNESQLCIRHF